MRLYTSSTKQFIHGCESNQIAEKLKTAFYVSRGHYPGEAEIASWRNSLRALADVFRLAGFESQGIILEYQLPLTSRRVDCIITGKDSTGNSTAVLIELKQWSKANLGTGPNEVVTFVGKAPRTVLHPSVQVQNYLLYLRDSHEAFHSSSQAVHAHGCSYLHNYVLEADDPLLDKRFAASLEECPIFGLDDVNDIIAFLTHHVGYGEGLDVAAQVEKNSFRASKKLMEHVSQVVAGLPQYILLDDQLLTFDAVLNAARKGFNDRKKSIILVKGGPGTGKSVVALNLLGTLMQEGYSANYATGSKAFTETLRKVIGRRGSTSLKYTHNYIDAQGNAIDVLIIDEAHRIREKTKIMYKPLGLLTQFEELLNASKVIVLFIDDDQTVRPGEIGSAQYIRDAAKAHGADLQEFELDVQFRCGGADGFVNWVDNVLGIRETSTETWIGDENFVFKIVQSPSELEERIREQFANGRSARMAAGFCWPWSKPRADGTLVPDVTLGTYSRSWNAKPNAGKLAPGIPEAALWATDPNGIEQIGCVYTAQGFEFDYVGVIFGTDLKYDPFLQSWIGNPAASHDKEVKRSDDFLALVKNTYRVLLSRGMKGCYIYFEDKATEEYFRSRMVQ